MKRKESAKRHSLFFVSYIGVEEGLDMRRGHCAAAIGICALCLGLGILIAAVFPAGALLIIIALLLIACGIICLKDRR